MTFDRTLHHEGAAAASRAARTVLGTHARSNSKMPVPEQNCNIFESPARNGTPEARTRAPARQTPKLRARPPRFEKFSEPPKSPDHDQTINDHERLSTEPCESAAAASRAARTIPRDTRAFEQKMPISEQNCNIFKNPAHTGMPGARARAKPPNPQTACGISQNREVLGTAQITDNQQSPTTFDRTSTGASTISDTRGTASAYPRYPR